MVPYILLALIIFVEIIMWFFINKNTKTKFLFSLIPALVLLVIFSLRNVNVGLDTENYMKIFVRSTDFPHSKITDDFGFYVFNWFVRLFTSNFNVFLFICGLIVCSALFFFIFFFVDSPGVGYLIFIFTTLSMMMSALRQILALSFIMFAIIFYFKFNKNIVLSLLFIFISFTFHISALVFLLAILFLFLPNKNYVFIFLIFLTVFFALFGDSFAKLLALIGVSLYGMSGTISNVPEMGIYVCGICIIFKLMSNNNIIFESVNNFVNKFKIGFTNRQKNNLQPLTITNKFILPSLLVSAFMMLSTSNPVLPRTAIFFVPFLMVASNVLCNNKTKKMEIVSTSLFSVASLSVFASLFLFSDRLGCIPFEFLWQA